jgi:hypothetical protein
MTAGSLEGAVGAGESLPPHAGQRTVATTTIANRVADVRAIGLPDAIDE